VGRLKSAVTRTGGTVVRTAATPLTDGTSVQVLRPADMLNVTFRFFNLSLVLRADGSYLVKTNAAKDAYLTVTFPPQAMREGQFIRNPPGYPTGSPSPLSLQVPYWALLGGETRLSFGINPVAVDASAGDSGIAYSLGGRGTRPGLLGWGFRTRAEADSAYMTAPYELPDFVFMRNDAAGLPQDGLDGRLVPMSQIEVPYRLVTVPSGGDWTWWQHRIAEDIAPQGKVELWHSILGGMYHSIANSDQQLIGREVAPPTMSAVYTETYDGVIPGWPDDRYRTSLKVGTLSLQDRTELVSNTTASLPVSDGLDPRRPFDLSLLMLTSQGASFKATGSWPKRNLVAWRHRITIGRDNFVQTEIAGYVFPLGHKATLVTTVERVLESSSIGETIAVLEVTERLIKIKEPVKSFDSRALPFSQVTFKTLKANAPAAGTPWAYFDCELLDKRGESEPVKIPVVFVEAGPGGGERKPPPDTGTGYTFAAARTAYNDTLFKDGFDVSGLVITYADPTGASASEACSAETLRLALDAAWDNGSYEAAGVWGPAFHPLLRQADIKLPGGSALASVDPVTVKYAQPYLDFGFAEAGNEGEVLFEVLAGAAGPPVLMMDGESGGAIAAPNIGVTGISRKAGAFGGSIDAFAKGQPEVGNYFGSQSTPPSASGALVKPASIDLARTGKILGEIFLPDLMNALKGYLDADEWYAPKFRVDVLDDENQTELSTRAIKLKLVKPAVLVFLDWNWKVKKDGNLWGWVYWYGGKTKLDIKTRTCKQISRGTVRPQPGVDIAVADESVEFVGGLDGLDSKNTTQGVPTPYFRAMGVLRHRKWDGFEWTRCDVATVMNTAKKDPLGVETPAKTITYKRGNRTAEPSFTPEARKFTGSVDVTIKTATAGADIYYSTDGSEVTQDSIKYSGPVHITAETELKARAVKTGLAVSHEHRVKYVSGTSSAIPLPLTAEVVPGSNTGSVRTLATRTPPNWSRYTPEGDYTVEIDERGRTYIEPIPTGAIGAGIPDCPCVTGDKVLVTYKYQVPPQGIWVAGNLDNFALVLPGFWPILRLEFGTVAFKWVHGGHRTFDIKVTNVELTGKLTLLSKLSAYFHIGGWGIGFSIKLEGLTVVATLTIGIPDVAFAVFALTDLVFEMTYKHPFNPEDIRTGKVPTISFSVGSREKPFALAIMLVGGKGFFKMEFSSKRLTKLEVSFEFGAIVTVSFGPVKASVSQTGGIYYTLEWNAEKNDHFAKLSAFMQVSGTVKVLILEVSLLMRLELEYQEASNSLYGRATFTVTIKCWCFKASKTLTYERTLAGGGKAKSGLTPAMLTAEATSVATPRFAEAMPAQADWDGYCRAYATVPIVNGGVR
jgi:hypothetical protein